MMTDADHLTAAAEHMAAADRALVGKRPDPARAAHYATVAGGHYLAALCAGHRPALPEPDHHDVYAEDRPDTDPAHRIEGERDQLAAQVAELTARLDDVIGRTQCDRAALARVRKLADGWARDGRIPPDVIADLRAALDGQGDNDAEPAKRGAFDVARDALLARYGTTDPDRLQRLGADEVEIGAARNIADATAEASR